MLENLIEIQLNRIGLGWFRFTKNKNKIKLNCMGGVVGITSAELKNI